MRARSATARLPAADRPEPDAFAPPPYLILSRHDYRSRRRVNLHFIADELTRRGPTRFFSLGFSRLAERAGDPRRDLAGRANRVEQERGVECFLWRTPVHPFNPRRPWLQGAASLGFRLYARLPQPTLDGWIRESGTILIESGLSVLFFDRVRRLNPGARTIYLAADDLATIGCAPHLEQVLERTAPCYDRVVLTSRRLRSTLPASARTCLVPHGIDRPALAAPGPSPYGRTLNGVSVGSMLFDPGLIETAARRLPAIDFHVIGAGAGAKGLGGPNIRVHAEMSFADTLPYLAHADFGIAPYRQAEVSPYLADTSMKLMQYESLGLPAVCPSAAADGRPGRFGYDARDPASVETAIRAALASGRVPSRRLLSWADVTERILHPARFPDTVLPEGAFHAAE